MNATAEPVKLKVREGDAFPLKVEISFDDGHISDIKAARLMEKYGFSGTFYNSNAQLKGTIKMEPIEISREILKRGHVIGGHTISHPSDMKLMEDEKMKFELENVYHGTPYCYGTWRDFSGFPQRTMDKFCYPRGRHDERVRKAVKDAGYLEARTTQVFRIRNTTGDPYQTPTTIHMFARSEYGEKHWFDLAVEYFDRALEESSYDRSVFFSLWGHSKELDQQEGDWERFETLLAYMRSKLSPQQNGANGAIGI